jgi:A/G-specific adenine glycosylase
MTREERVFVKTVWKYYKLHGRHDHPWRNVSKTLPLSMRAYRIMVSEVMLQQTQVDRVVFKYKSFLKRFPSPKILAEAPLGEVLREWQGLGYNRRAKMLHETAKIITHSFRGLTPKSYEELRKLPGIGHYTAGAVMAFAYNEAVPIIETNIRTAYIHHFFADDVDVTDAELFTYIDRTLDRKNPKDWYYALMDYGMFLKKTEGNLNNRSKHYTKQSAFKNSDRQIRGAILKLLSENLPAGRQDYTRAQLFKKLPFEKDRIDVQLLKLKEEGLIQKKGSVYQLP